MESDKWEHRKLRACINFLRSVQESTVRGFCHQLVQMCQGSGMEFNFEPGIPIHAARPDQMGGRNTVLLDALRWRIPLVSDIPTIIFGADVTHPESGEDSCSLLGLARSYKILWFSVRSASTPRTYSRLVQYLARSQRWHSYWRHDQDRKTHDKCS